MRQNEIRRILNLPYSQELIRSNIPVRLAYVGVDGAPRVVPLGYHWNGSTFIIGTIPASPKVKALKANPKVAMTIDSNTFPPHVLLVRGAANCELVDGIPPEYLEASKKQVSPEQWQGFETQVRSMYKQMVRIEIVPEWAKLIDFETTLPGPVEKLMKEQASAAT